MIGRADIEKVFTEYQPKKDFEAETEQIQQDFQQARSEGNREKLVEIHEQFQSKQTHLVEKFRAELAEAAGSVSEKTDVDMIVADVLYTKDDSGLKDVSDELIKEME